MWHIFACEMKYSIKLTLIMLSIILGLDILSYFYPLFDLSNSNLPEMGYMFSANVFYQYGANYEKQNRADIFEILPVRDSQLKFIRILWIISNLVLAVILDFSFRVLVLKNFNILSYFNAVSWVELIVILAGCQFIYRDINKVYMHILDNNIKLQVISAIAFVAIFAFFYCAITFKPIERSVLSTIVMILTIIFTLFSYKYRFYLIR